MPTVYRFKQLRSAQSPEWPRMPTAGRNGFGSTPQTDWWLIPIQDAKVTRYARDAADAACHYHAQSEVNPFRLTDAPQSPDQSCGWTQPHQHMRYNQYGWLTNKTDARAVKFCVLRLLM